MDKYSSYYQQVKLLLAVLPFAKNKTDKMRVILSRRPILNKKAYSLSRLFYYLSIASYFLYLITFIN